jgi:hypothetical protein
VPVDTGHPLTQEVNLARSGLTSYYCCLDVRGQTLEVDDFGNLVIWLR